MVFVYPSLQVRNSLIGFAILHLFAFALSTTLVCLHSACVLSIMLCLSCSLSAFLAQILILSAFLWLSAFALIVCNALLSAWPVCNAMYVFICSFCNSLTVCISSMCIYFCLHRLYQQLLCLPVYLCSVCNSLPFLNVLFLLFFCLSACMLSAFIYLYACALSALLCPSACFYLQFAASMHVLCLRFLSEYVLSVCMCSVCNFLSVCS